MLGSENILGVKNSIPWPSFPMTSLTSTSTIHPSLTASLIQPSCSLMASFQLFTLLVQQFLLRHYPCQVWSWWHLESSAPLTLCCTTWKNANPPIPNHWLFPYHLHLSEHPLRKPCSSVICTTLSSWLPPSNWLSILPGIPSVFHALLTLPPYKL